MPTVCQALGTQGSSSIEEAVNSHDCFRLWSVLWGNKGGERGATRGLWAWAGVRSGRMMIELWFFLKWAKENFRQRKQLVQRPYGGNEDQRGGVALV